MASDYDFGVSPSGCLGQNPSESRGLSALGANLSDPVNLRFAPCTQ